MEIDNSEILELYRSIYGKQVEQLTYDNICLNLALEKCEAKIKELEVVQPVPTKPVLQN